MATLDVAGQELVNVGEPASASSAATRGFVEETFASTIIVIMDGSPVPGGTPAGTAVVRPVV